MFPYVPQVHFAGWFHVLYFGLIIPFAVMRGARRRVAAAGIAGAAANLHRHFRNQAMMLVFLTALSLIVARGEWIDLFPRRVPGAMAWAAGLLMYVAAVAFMRPRWRRAVEAGKPIVRLFMPRSVAERAWWVTVSTLAGVGEEITWRGVQFGVLVALTGSPVAAAVLSAVSFGIGHYNQGWRSSAIIVVFALGFQAVVWLSGALYVAMAVHVAYDITAGIAYGRLGRELGHFTTDGAATGEPVTPAAP